MNPRDAYETILAALQRAALDDARWLASRALFGDAAGASRSTLLVGEGLDNDFRINFARLLRRGENRQDVLRQYFDLYYAHDEGVRRIRPQTAGQLVHIPDLLTEDERKHSSAYNEGWRLPGGRNGAYVHFDEPDDLRLVWAIGDTVDGDGWRFARRRLIKRLLPHVRQFVHIRQALATAGASDAGLAGLLDNRRIGVVHPDRSGCVLAANAPALAILRRGDDLFDTGGGAGAGGGPGVPTVHRPGAGGHGARPDAVAGPLGDAAGRRQVGARNRGADGLPGRPYKPASEAGQTV